VRQQDTNPAYELSIWTVFIPSNVLTCNAATYRFRHGQNIGPQVGILGIFGGIAPKGETVCRDKRCKISPRSASTLLRYL